MKKFFTLMILSAFVAVSAFAEDSGLGDVKWSIKDGAKINPAKTITLTSLMLQVSSSALQSESQVICMQQMKHLQMPMPLMVMKVQ